MAHERKDAGIERQHDRNAKPESSASAGWIGGEHEIDDAIAFHGAGRSTGSAPNAIRVRPAPFN